MQVEENTKHLEKYAHLAPHVCPTCHSGKGFSFAGEQNWPPRVAEHMGISPVVTLWRCANCDTTITVET